MDRPGRRFGERAAGHERDLPGRGAPLPVERLTRPVRPDACAGVVAGPDATATPQGCGAAAHARDVAVVALPRIRLGPHQLTRLRPSRPLPRGTEGLPEDGVRPHAG